MKNKTIVWYTVKYALLWLITQYSWSYAGKLATAKNDVENIIGYAIFVGLLLTIVLILKKDVTQFVKYLQLNKENNENK